MAARIPVAVYRLQFHQNMRFEDARGLVPYLKDLGISDLYASPILQARRGSAHGYDVTDPSRLNPELGSEEEFENLSRQLQAHGMGLLLDIVPNHMAASSENPWWMDMLEEGPGSAYAAYFDVDWHPPSRFLDNRILLPLLANPYAEALETRQLTLTFEEGGFFIRYFDIKLPVAPKAYRQILEHRLDRLKQTLTPESPVFQEFEGILIAVDRLPERAALLVEKASERRLALTAIKERLRNLHNNSPEIRRFIEQNVWVFNGKKGSPASFRFLDRLLSDQAYVISFWRNSNEGINYRRFFTITDLVGVRVEDPLTFDATHSVILRLAERGLITGLRIDHIDGLRDPAGYLRRLQERLVPANGQSAAQTQPGGNGKVTINRRITAHSTPPAPFYVVVEKILAACESLPREWPVYGTTGYDFLNYLNGIFVDTGNVEAIEDTYTRFGGLQVAFDDLVYEKKKQVLENLLAVEMNTLGRRLSLLAEQDRYARELPRGDLARALLETIACLPVYRTYLRSFEVNKTEARFIETAINAAQQRNPGLNPACFDFLCQVLLLQPGPQVFPEQREARLAFVMRWQQFTGPLMAKGFEDSLLYVYNRLVSLNEVGGFPNLPGISVSDFHQFGRQRQKKSPHALNATTTHDTKRSEDVRARINVLSEIPEEWDRHLFRWRRWNESWKRNVNGTLVPTPNEEIMLYQTMLGAWPLQHGELPNFKRRLQDYMIKATREAMVYTKWTRPNERHEKAILDFIASILKNEQASEFLDDFLAFEKKIAFYGALNGLAQVLIKIAFPGVPDFYQGSELWDLRLVDPDNRGPVNFGARGELLGKLCGEGPMPAGSSEELFDSWHDGRIKMVVICKALGFRRAHPELFSQGDYIPLQCAGNKQGNVFAFCRRSKTAWALVIVPRLSTRLVSPGQPRIGKEVWGTTRLSLPPNAPKEWLNIFTGEKLVRETEEACLHLRDVFRNFPVALLASQ
ncbi:MAG TPA: malto-oligosyltrehalose synthase [Terriglobales bacterium]|nr:malto-oligosyltrehalose synthase [Terriglobales bacterium]